MLISIWRGQSPNATVSQTERAVRVPLRAMMPALLLFIIGAIMLSWPWVGGSVTIPWDAKAHFFPQFSFLAQSLHSGQNPFWTPNVFTGWPQIADPQSLIFSPPFLLAALLESAPSFQLADGIVFAMLSAGGIGIMLFFADRGWHCAGALLAALAFAFGGSAAWRVQHIELVLSLAWFPLALWALARTLERGSALWGLAAGIFAAFMLLGRDQIAMLGAWILAAYVIAHLAGSGSLRAALQKWRPLCAAFAAGLAITIVPLAFTIALAQSSNRPAIDLAGAHLGSLHPGSLLSLISPNLFGVAGPLSTFWGPPSKAWGVTDLYLARNMGALYFGALPMIALIGGFGVSFWKDRNARFLLFACIAMALYMLGRTTPVFAWMYLIPGVDLFRRPADATFLFCALAAMLAGFGLHCLINGLVRWRALNVAAISIAAIVLCGVMAASKGQWAMAQGPVVLAAIMFALAFLALNLLVRRQGQGFVCLLTVGVLMVADLATGNAPNESTGLPPATYDVLRKDTRNATIALLKDTVAATQSPDRRDRIELAGIDFHWPNASLVHGLEHDLGYNPLRLNLFTAFTGAGDHLALPEQRMFASAFPSYRSIAADLTGLRFIATGVPAEQIDPQLKPGNLTLIARTADAFIYENPRAMPRVSIATQARFASFADILAKGAWPDVDYASTVLFDGPSSLPIIARAHGSARVVSYTNTIIDVSADAPDGGWLVLRDIWHPWWQASIDGVPAPILRADVVFRAVALTPGRHHVRFIFAPFTGLWRDIVAGVAGARRAP